MKEYYSTCAECEHLYHCFGRKVAEDIQKGEVSSMYERPDKCRSFYPEVRQ